MTASEDAGKKLPRNLKRCPRCGKVKNRAQSYTYRADGTIFSWCKACNKAYAQERAAKRKAEQGRMLEGGY